MAGSPEAGGFSLGGRAFVEGFDAAFERYFDPLFASFLGREGAASLPRPRDRRRQLLGATFAILFSAWRSISIWA